MFLVGWFVLFCLKALHHFMKKCLNFHDQSEQENIEQHVPIRLKNQSVPDTQRNRMIGQFSLP